MVLVLWMGTVALADTVICVDRFAPVQLAVTVGLATDALADRDIDTARARLSVALDRLPCLTEVIDPALLGHLARVVAQCHHELGHEAQAQRWAAVSRGTGREIPWTYVFPPSHPFRQLVAGVEVPEVAQGEGHLAVPPGGGVFVNGRLLERPEAPSQGPVLVQVFDDQQRLVDGWWQEGARFPAGILSALPAAVPPPLWWKGDGPTSARYRPLNLDYAPVVPITPPEP